eukprot:37042_1
METTTDIEVEYVILGGEIKSTRRKFIYLAIFAILLLVGASIGIYFLIKNTQHGNKNSSDSLSNSLSEPTSQPTNSPTYSSSPITSDPLTGVYFMNKAYNMLSGQQLYSQSGVDIISYQWNGRVTSSVSASTSDTSYEIPIEFRSVPEIAPQCEINEKVNSVYYSTSTNVLNEMSHSSSYGFSQTVNLKAGIDIDGVTAEASTSFTNALMFGKSSGSTTAREYASNSYTWSFSMETAVKYYQAEIDWNDDTIHFQYKDSFIKALDNLNDNPTNKIILSFIDKWGSHVLTQMQTGATCKETAYSSSKSSKYDVSDFQKHVSSTSFSFLFFHYNSQSNSETQTSGTYENNVEYEFDDIYCKGEIEDTSECGGLTGSNNNPVIISIFHIDFVVSVLSNDTMNIIDEFFQYLYYSLDSCANKYCNSDGACTLDANIWSDTFIEDTWDGIDFSMLWDTEEYCFCNEGAYGKNCSLSSNCLCYGSSSECCCYEDNTCDTSLLCDPIDTRCLTTDEPTVQCGTYGSFLSCSAGVIRKACGSGGDSDCAKKSGKCPSDAGYNGIYCDFTELGGYTSTGDWQCAYDYGISQSCLDDASGGNLMVGICGSGSGKDCKSNCDGNAGILCATVEGVDVDTSNCEWLEQYDYGIFLTCRDGYVATGYCGAGSHRDCDNNVFKLQCCKLSYN